MVMTRLEITSAVQVEKNTIVKNEQTAETASSDVIPVDILLDSIRPNIDETIARIKNKTPNYFPASL